MASAFSATGINGQEVRKTVFLTADAKKVLTPKTVTHTATVDKVDLTLTYKVGTKLKAIRQELSSTACYDPSESVDHILSEEEVADRIDPNRTSDAFMFCEPELDTDAVSPLAMEDKLDRYAWFVAICNRVAEQDMLEYILENAPKKKNGTFAKNKLTVVAALPIVFYAEMSYYEIVGKAKTDNTLELSIQERKFSDEELFRATENVYLKYIASGKKSSVQKTEYVKLFLEGHKKTVIEVPTILMEDGRLAIAAKPYRAISDFQCVVGDDKKGYKIILPKNIEPCQINHEGKTIYVDSNLEAGYCGLNAIWSNLSETVQYIRTRNKKLHERAVITITGNNVREIPERYLSEFFIAEYFYQLLFAVDDLHRKVNDPSFVQYVVDNATYKRDGTLNRGNKGTQKIYTVPTEGRTVPLVRIRLECSNRENDKIHIIYWTELDRFDTWSEYTGI